MTPVSRKNKFSKRFAAALRRLPFPQSLWQRFCITWISQRNHAHRFPSFRNAKALPGGICVKSTHLMRRESQGCSLENEIRSGLSEIVETVPIWLTIFFETRVRERKNQHGSVPSQCPVRIHQDPGDRTIVLRIVFHCYQERPRLLISGGRSPTSRFQHAEQFIGFDRLLGKRARAPAPPD